MPSCDTVDEPRYPPPAEARFICVQMDERSRASQYDFTPYAVIMCADNEERRNSGGSQHTVLSFQYGVHERRLNDREDIREGEPRVPPRDQTKMCGDKNTHEGQPDGMRPVDTLSRGQETTDRVSHPGIQLRLATLPPGPLLSVPWIFQ
jgi:hypothetical protein